MKYEVIHFFTDLQDFSHPYNVGDLFPREGMRVSEERIKELSSNQNRQKKPLIKMVEDEQYEELPFPIDETKYTRTDINRMNKAELQELAKNTGVESADGMTGSELKEYLLNVFKL